MCKGIITHFLITCKLHLSSLAKSPNQCCKLSLKSPEGMDNKIFTINNLQKSRRSRELETINLSSTGQEIVHYQLPIYTCCNI